MYSDAVLYRQRQDVVVHKLKTAAKAAICRHMTPADATQRAV
jgi:hypothetical protein